VNVPRAALVPEPPRLRWRSNKVTVTRDTFGVATGVLAKILAAEPLLPEDPW